MHPLTVDGDHRGQGAVAVGRGFEERADMVGRGFVEGGGPVAVDGGGNRVEPRQAAGVPAGGPYVEGRVKTRRGLPPPARCRPVSGHPPLP